MLEPAMNGEVLIVPALQEGAFGDDPLAPRTTATRDGQSLRINGAKSFVCADGAAGFLVSANGGDGLELCYVSRDAAGLSLSTTESVDGRRLATLTFKNTPADPVPARQSSRNGVDALHSLALIALSAELLGVMEKAQAVTFDYLRIRKQFGKLIGSFQALQHKAVDIYIRTETTRSLLFQVAANSDPYRIDPALAVATKAKASEDAMFVTQACIQLHGGIGFTDEHEIGLYLKRAMLLSSQLGNAAAQRRRYVSIAGQAES
jgi:alkylation response protein AidB-like acyl-CoA dehydrogenase